MTQITVNRERIGVGSFGIKTPIIRPGDDLKEIVIASCLNAMGEFHDNAVIGVTEAVLAIAQGNFVTPEDIQRDIASKYPNEYEITLLFPIQSRNRFMNIMQAIADMPQFSMVNVILSYPCDEVGNRLVSDEAIFNRNTDCNKEEFYPYEFYNAFGKPRHIFTGKNYIEEFQKTNPEKVKVILNNNLISIADYYSQNVLVCTIRKEQRELQKRILKERFVENVYDLSEILNEPVNGSGYSPEYGVYGSNKMADGKLKLMPRDSQEFVESVQKAILERYGKHVEVMVYGDGAFKDPVGGIWELADPVTTLGATAGLTGTPKEVKLKYLASKYGNDKTQNELAEIIAKEKEMRLNTNDVTEEASLGTTPRKITDLLASQMDLISGSGDRQTPVVYVTGYLQ